MYNLLSSIFSHKISVSAAFYLINYIDYKFFKQNAAETK